jgi:ElaB/YqjD/DUF883 family membrane-anchored ribosome-binding protein
MSTQSTGEVSKEKLMRDLRLVVSDAEELLRATAGQAGEKVSAARERIQENLAAAKERLNVAERIVIDKAKQAATASDQYAHENLWKAVGIGAGIGLVVGMLLTRDR